MRLKKADVLQQNCALSPQGLVQFVKDVKDTGLLKHLSDQHAVESFHKKQTLYAEAKRPRFLYYLVKGKVKAFRGHEDGKEYITDLFSAGDFIGYTALLEDKNYDDSAIILEEAEIMQIPRDEFLGW